MYPTLKTDTTNTKRTQFFRPKFKVTVALEALRGDKTRARIAAKHKVSSNAGLTTVVSDKAIDGLTGELIFR